MFYGASQSSDATAKVEGDDYLALGADSYTNPQKLPAGKYVSSMNTISRGGMPRTRPGSNTIMTLPSGNLQGMTIFKPANGVPQIVAAVNGKIYSAPYPFTNYTQLPNLQFNPAAKYIAWATCIKSTDYDTAGALYFLTNPYTVLIIQDGFTRAGLWDGTTDRHMNPTHSTVYTAGGEVITQEGLDETPMGLWMCWANNRLWLSRGNQVFASDIGNPTKFTESLYLNEGRSFLLPDNCTGIVPTTDKMGIMCFTEETGTFFMSSLQDRTQWVSTKDFQKLILPAVGCVAPRSINTSYGLVWWYSAKGLMNQNDATQSNISSKIDVQDNAMFETKAGMSYDLSGVCSASYENFMLCSVPYEDKFNTRTMVMDQTPIGEVGAQWSAWSSFWTGWRPVEFASGVINGEERIFICSVDYDGRNRVWELFTQNRTDNGIPITCYVQSREYLFGDRDYKMFKYAEVELRGLRGDVSVQLALAGIRGSWQPIGTKEIVATHGQVYADSKYGTSDHSLAGSSDQLRVIKSVDAPDGIPANQAGVEERFSGPVDRGFSLMVYWSGIAALQSIRMVCEYYPLNLQGACELNETAPNMLNTEGYGAKDYFTVDSPFTTYTSTKSFSKEDPTTAIIVSYSATAKSLISQEDADRKALKSATNYVLTTIGEL